MLRGVHLLLLFLTVALGQTTTTTANTTTALTTTTTTPPPTTTPVPAAEGLSLWIVIAIIGAGCAALAIIVMIVMYVVANAATGRLNARYSVITTGEHPEIRVKLHSV